MAKTQWVSGHTWKRKRVSGYSRTVRKPSKKRIVSEKIYKFKRVYDANGMFRGLKRVK